MVIISEILLRLTRLKCCPDPDMDPILIGRSFSYDEEKGPQSPDDDDTLTAYSIDDTDFLEQRFWEPKKMPLNNIPIAKTPTVSIVH